MSRPAMVVRTVRVPPALWQQALQVAQEREEAVSDVVRAALERYVKKYGTTKPPAEAGGVNSHS